jgi:2,3-bisphosphoglycerate-independent phosphoglycerate mutase|tara:strand:+ start:1596 stop:3113 length:1518 start_codon:yes stop_codon:yes gene_type:complete
MKKTALIILDGWGHSQDNESNAIFHANTPYIDSLYNKSLNTEIKTHGEYVGLPKGQMGNSEVGHLNIGAGRVVYQDLAKINNDIHNDKLKHNQELLHAINTAKERSKPLHIMGLLSNGGIHSHINHLKAICECALQNNVSHIFIHGFTDGRDSDPKSGKKHITDLLKYIDGKNITLASIIGRYYAMDRDKRWERTTLTYNMLVNGHGKKSQNIINCIAESYRKEISDEFILPIVMVDDKQQAVAQISDQDVVICFNFRSDRCRQIVTALTQVDIPQYQTKSLNIELYTMTCYDETFEEIKVFYPRKNIKNTIGEVISNAGLTQLRIAETEKYPHVTFFFSGGREKKFNNEYRALISSPKVATYDLKPEMSAEEVTQTYIDELNNTNPDFICLNYANPDMVGHTGNFNAVVKTLEFIDKCLYKIVSASLKKNYAIIIIADHGNAEMMINKDNTPHTAHTTNKVPCFILNTNYKFITEGSLCDIAPTILNIMNLDKPSEMTGKSIIN